jgi:K+-sensing histidine kinase KdpD
MKNSKTLLIFYILVGYICLQFAWWMVMLFNLNNELTEKKLELISMQINSETPEYIEIVRGINNNLRNKWMMIMGEGSVFLLLLLLGIFQTQRAFKKEIALSEQQKNFLLAVTHELKSPIASAKLHLQTLKKHNLDKDKQLKLLDNAIYDNERLNQLVDKILLTSRFESGNFKLHKQETDISSLIENIINSSLSEKKNHIISLDIPKGIIFPVDQLAFSSILQNLFENAQKYSPEGSSIGIRVKKNEKSISIHVADNGTGIPDNEKKKVFKKFYRSGNEEIRNTKGTGLGLFIVKYLVEKHNGKIHIKDNHPKGSIFEVIL